MAVTWSESVYLDCVAPDGRTGFVGRLARHTDEGASWLWLHVFLSHQVLGFNRDDLPCGTNRTDVEAPDACYDVRGEVAARFRRHGARDGMRVADVIAEVFTHVGAEAPATPGVEAVRLEAVFAPRRAAGSTLAGRTEVLGEVAGTVRLPRGNLELSGLGHWHEQHQEQPRFRVPFTYATVRAADLAFVALRAGDLSRGFVRRGDDAVAIEDFTIDPPGWERSFTLTLEGGERLVGTATATHRYSVPIYGHPRPGSVVTADVGGITLSGCINDWVPPR